MDNENVKALDVFEEEGNINTDVVAVTAKRRKKAQKGKKNRSSGAKQKTSTSRKHIEVKRKVSKGLGPLKASLSEEESGSESKRRKILRKEKVLPRDERNKILNSQKVMSGRVFDPWIFNQPGMVELVEFIKHQKWMHLFEKLVSLVFENEVRDLFYTIMFVKDVLSLTKMMQGIKMELNEEILRNILEIPIVGIKSVKNQQPSVEFMQTTFKVGGTYYRG